MAMRIKPCDCDCANQADACNCGTVACGLVCQSKAGDATLCGFLEYDSPSDPPKKYRTETVGGIQEGCRYNNSGSVCTTPGALGGFATIFSGAAHYDAATCVCTNGRQADLLGSDGASECGYGHDDGSSGIGNCGVFWPGSVPPSSTSRTNNAWDWATIQPCGPSTGYTTYTGTATTELTDEDTDGDAENRAAAAIDDWSACSSGCATSCSAFRTDRSGTTDTLFGYRKVQTKVTWTAEIGETYNVRVNFARRLLGSSGPFLDLGMPWESTVSADETSEHTDWVDVPSEAGWETIAASCVVELVP